MSELNSEPIQLNSEPKPERLFFIDNLRIALISLVVLHHLAVVYAANTGFYYVEPTTNIAAIVALAYFQLINQAYFMGLFFFLAGYFTPESYDRKGTGLYLKDRLLHLGVPLLIYIFVMNPLASTGVYQMPASLTGVTEPLTWARYPSMLAMGPFWFVVMLIVFCAVYVLWRLLTRQLTKTKPVMQKSPAPPKFAKIAIFIIILAAASYFIRIAVPIASPVLHFPSLAYLPQYASFFVLGIVANRKNWLFAIPDKFGKRGITVALVSLILFLIGMSPRFGSGAAFIGGGTAQSGIYAFWDSLFAVCVCIWLITLFRKRFNFQYNFCKALSRGAFTVYLIHCPVIVMMALLMRDVSITPLLKFLLMACICVPLCFALAYLIRKIPKADRIL